MTRIYQLDTIDTGDIDSTHLIVSEDNAGSDTVRVTLQQLAQYLFNFASSNDETNPFSGFSVAVGQGASASGSNSLAIGSYNAASGNHSTAVGYYNSANASWGTTAVGHYCSSSENQASAFGHGAIANGHSATAIGYNSTASGISSLAVGRNNMATQYGSTAIGYDNSVNCAYSTGCGYENQVGNTGAAYYAQAFGFQNTVASYEVPGNYCTALGVRNTVFGPYAPYGFGEEYNGKSTACGYENFVAGCYNSAFGASNEIATMGFVFKSQAIGYNNTASGYWGSSAFGYRNQASDIQTSAFGHKNIANGGGASAFGNNNTASGYGSIACGYNNTASNEYSSAFGAYNNINGSSATALGYSNTAQTSNSTACGYSCFAGYYNNTTALGYRAVARVEGTTNIAGPIIVRTDGNEGFSATDQFVQYSGVQNVVMSKNIDLTLTTFSISQIIYYGDGAGYTIGDTVSVTGGNEDAILTVSSVDGGGSPTGYTITNAGTGYSNGSNVATTNISATGDGNATVDVTVVPVIELDIPFNAAFYVDEVGIILQAEDTITVQPHVSFGWVENNASILASTQTTNLTAYKSREVFASLLNYDGQTTLTAAVTTGASATVMYGRFYFKGILVEMIVGS